MADRESAKQPLHIGYVVSMTQPGLIAWVYREMVGLEELGVRLSVYPTKFYKGPHMPKPGWFTARWTAARVIWAHLKWLLRSPVTYFRALFSALRFRAFVEFGLAGYYSREMLARDVDRIHCHLGDRKLYVGYYCHLLTGIRLSVTIHAHEMYVNPNWALFPVALEACDKVICIADMNRRMLAEKWGVQEDKMKVVRLFGFSDLEQRDPTVILCVGRYERKKGHDLLLGALARLREEHPEQDVEVWLAGGPAPGDAGVDIEGLMEEYGLEQYVVRFGQLEQQSLRVLYRNADIFCLLSRHQEGVPEGIPVVLMEAMSMAKPVVTTNTGATGELVENIVIPEDDPDAAFEALKTLVFDAELRRIQGARNLKIIAENYSPENVSRLLRALEGD
jgi:glycosyltransferase involved in cell wall biosynthesis